jgi:hypothetical protein
MDQLLPHKHLVSTPQSLYRHWEEQKNLLHLLEINPCFSCSLSSVQGLSPQMKTERFSTITAIAISKKEAFTGSFIAMELLELCQPLTKERNNGLGSQVPPPQRDRDIAQCRPALLCINCEHSVLWFKRRDKFLLPVLIWQITHFTLVNSSKYVCDCTFYELEACFTISININHAILLEWSPIL